MDIIERVANNYPRLFAWLIALLLLIGASSLRAAVDHRHQIDKTGIALISAPTALC
jgi:hypothetical protein